MKSTVSSKDEEEADTQPREEKEQIWKLFARKSLPTHFPQAAAPQCVGHGGRGGCTK